MARAIWKGILRIGTAEVPVKLYSAVEDRSIHFRLLHEKDRVPVKQHMVNPETGDVVESEEIQRGHEIEPGTFVVLSEEELEQAEPDDAREIEALRFVPATAIDGRWYDRPYWLGPDGETAAYAALRDALEGEERVGVMRWVMRKREYIGALRIREKRMMLVTLRHAGEVVEAKELPAPEGRAMTAAEAKMADRLIESLSGPFDPEDFRDEYRDRVLEVVKAKAKGKRVPARRRPKQRKQGSLEDMLRRSVANGKKKRRAVA